MPFTIVLYLLLSIDQACSLLFVRSPRVGIEDMLSAFEQPVLTSNAVRLGRKESGAAKVPSTSVLISP